MKNSVLMFVYFVVVAVAFAFTEPSEPEYQSCVLQDITFHDGQPYLNDKPCVLDIDVCTTFDWIAEDDGEVIPIAAKYKEYNDHIVVELD